MTRPPEPQTVTALDDDHPTSGEPPTPESAPLDLTIRHDPGADMYEATLNGELVAGIAITRSGDHVTVLSTSVFPQHRGRGIAGRFLGAVLDEFRAQGLTVTTSCPYATAFVNAHPEYHDLLVSTTGDGRAIGRRTRG